MVERINCTTEEIRVLKQIELIEDTELFVLLNCGGRFFTILQTYLHPFGMGFQGKELVAFWRKIFMFVCESKEFFHVKLHHIDSDLRLACVTWATRLP